MLIADSPVLGTISNLQSPITNHQSPVTNLQSFDRSIVCPSPKRSRRLQQAGNLLMGAGVTAQGQAQKMNPKSKYIRVLLPCANVTLRVLPIAGA